MAAARRKCALGRDLKNLNSSSLLGHTSLASQDQLTPPNRSKKAFNVESPSFTPSNTSKKSTFTPQALSAAPFTPRGNSGTATSGVPCLLLCRHCSNPVTAGNASTPPIQHKNGDQAGFLNPAAIPEFTPQNFGLSATTVGLLRLPVYLLG